MLVADSVGRGYCPNGEGSNDTRSLLNTAVVQAAGIQFCLLGPRGGRLCGDEIAFSI